MRRCPHIPDPDEGQPSNLPTPTSANMSVMAWMHGNQIVSMARPGTQMPRHTRPVTTLGDAYHEARAILLGYCSRRGLRVPALPDRWAAPQELLSIITSVNHQGGRPEDIGEAWATVVYFPAEFPSGQTGYSGGRYSGGRLSLPVHSDLAFLPGLTAVLGSLRCLFVVGRPAPHDPTAQPSRVRYADVDPFNFIRAFLSEVPSMRVDIQLRQLVQDTDDPHISPGPRGTQVCGMCYMRQCIEDEARGSGGGLANGPVVGRGSLPGHGSLGRMISLSDVGLGGAGATSDSASDGLPSLDPPSDPSSCTSLLAPTMAESDSDSEEPPGLVSLGDAETRAQIGSSNRIRWASAWASICRRMRIDRLFLDEASRVPRRQNRSDEVP
jgi:hypothetical protein